MKQIRSIKPCPFCGKTPELRYALDRALIECSNRKCALQPSTWLYVNTDSVSKLIDTWNSRKGAE